MMGRVSAHRVRATLIPLVIGVVGLCGLTAHATPPGPLTPALRTAAEAPPSERPYPVRMHFLTSNERRHDLFFPALLGRGGAYVGVASDQNYTLAAVAEAQAVWLLDIDEEVILWHDIYAALVPAADSPLALRALLDGHHHAEVAAALDARWRDEAQPPVFKGAAPTLLYRAYLRNRGRIHAHLVQETQPGRDNQVPSWLNDATLYARVRDLMIARRVIARVGDLHGEQTLLGIATAARALRLPVRTVYLSNTEQWFHYSPQLRRNLDSLPRDERSIVLRTLARRELPRPTGDRWHFSVQSLGEFTTHMLAPGGPRKVHDLMPEMVRAGAGAAGRDPALPRGLSLLPGVTLLPGALPVHSATAPLTNAQLASASRLHRRSVTEPLRATLSGQLDGRCLPVGRGAPRSSVALITAWAPRAIP